MAAARSNSLKKINTRNQTITQITHRNKGEIYKPRLLAQNRVKNKCGFRAIAIGISTGGPKTLSTVLPMLPKKLNAAIFIVQHMPAHFTKHFAERLNTICNMPCAEAEAGMLIEPDKIYLAKGGYHMTLFQKQNGEVLIRTPVRPENLFIPSVDVMMDSVVNIFGSDTIGVLMTGMGDDGVKSMLKINEFGGVTIAESEESAVVFGMPGELVKLGGAQRILPHWDVADEIIIQCR
jgi:two-component system chemotaxis response regulator CheB